MTNLPILEPVLFTKFTEEQMINMKVSEVIKMMQLIGYSATELRFEAKFQTAWRDLINQVKYN
jgi:hypothetical protein